MNQIILSITAFMFLILWSVITIALIITIIGCLFLMILADDGWFEIPTKIVEKILE